MKLIEVVVLMGAHCISPVEHTPVMTEAAKVECAVVVEKDTDGGAVKVTPEEAASDPKVAAVVARFNQSPANGLTGAGTRIVPAWAPPGGSSTVVTPRPLNNAAAPAAPAPAPTPTPDDAAQAAADKPSSTTATEVPAEDTLKPAAEATSADKPAADTAPADVVAEATPETANDTPAPVLKKPVSQVSKPVQQKTAVQPVKRHASRHHVAKAQPAKQQASAKIPKKGGQCSGTSTPKWYTASDGRKKYRCVRMSDASPPQQAASGPKRQLY